MIAAIINICEPSQGTSPVTGTLNDNFHNESTKAFTPQDSSPHEQLANTTATQQLSSWTCEFLYKRTLAIIREAGVVNRLRGCALAYVADWSPIFGRTERSSHLIAEVGCWLVLTTGLPQSVHKCASTLLGATAPPHVLAKTAPICFAQLAPCTCVQSASVCL